MTTATPFTEQTLLENYRRADDGMKRLILRVAGADTEDALITTYRLANDEKKAEIRDHSFPQYHRIL